MGRILCIDYGRKRCGIAVTDPMKICANGLPTVRTCDLINFIKDYLQKENIETLVVGEPKDLKGNDSESAIYIKPFLKKIKQQFPHLPVVRVDERFTSTIAHRELIAGGFKKTQRQQKDRVDEMAAVIILTSYLESEKMKVGSILTNNESFENPV